MTEPQTEAGKALMRFMGWGPAWAKKIIAIEDGTHDGRYAGPRYRAELIAAEYADLTPLEVMGDRDRREAAAAGAAALARLREDVERLRDKSLRLQNNTTRAAKVRHEGATQMAAAVLAIIDQFGARAAEPKPPESGE